MCFNYETSLMDDLASKNCVWMYKLKNSNCHVSIVYASVIAAISD